MDRLQHVLLLSVALILVSGACSSRDSADAGRLCEILADLSSGSPLTPEGIGEELEASYSEAFEEMADIAPPEIRPSAEKALEGWQELSEFMEVVRRTGQQREGQIAEVGAPFLAGFEELLTWSESSCSLQP